MCRRLRKNKVVSLGRRLRPFAAPGFGRHQACTGGWGDNQEGPGKAPLSGMRPHVPGTGEGGRTEPLCLQGRPGFCLYFCYFAFNWGALPVMLRSHSWPRSGNPVGCQRSNPGSAACKAYAVPTVLWLKPMSRQLFLFCFSGESQQCSREILPQSQ